MDKMNVIFVLFALGSVFAAAEFVQLVTNLTDGCTLPVVVAVVAIALVAGVAVAAHLRRRARATRAADTVDCVLDVDSYTHFAQQRVKDRKDDIVWGGS